MKFTANYKCLKNIINFIKNEVKKISVNQEFIFDIELAAEEIIINIIKHNADLKTALSLEITCEKHPDNYLTLKIIDNGKAFNPFKKENPDINLSVKERKIGGLGLFLTKNLVDNLDYKYESNLNINILQKKLPL